MNDVGPRNAIAVIGMAGRFPGAASIDEFWGLLVAGRETISRFTDEELDDAGVAVSARRHPDYVPAKGVVENADDFDADLFGYAARDARRMDPQIRLLHTCAWEALEDAGVRPRSHDEAIGLFAGVNQNHEWMRRVEATVRPGDIDAFLLNHRDYAITRVAHALNLTGPAMTVLSACSTSLAAVHLASRALVGHDCDVAIAGGVSLSHPYAAGYLYQDGLMQSSDGHCRTFDTNADGTVFGDGAGVVVLKRLDRAVRDRDPIRAVILGSAVNNDGNGKLGFTAPSVEGQRQAIAAALRRAGVTGSQIGYVEAHGTATLVGDPIELQALTAAFENAPPGSCAIGSVKTNVGHVNVAAGAAALIKAVLMLENRQIPPHLHYGRANPAFDFSRSPFHVPTELGEWPEPADGTRRASVSSFGFGGTNAHLILQEAPPRPVGSAARRPSILALSANSPDALGRAVERLGEHLVARVGVEVPGTPQEREEARSRAQLADIAFTLATGREPMTYRRATVCETSGEAVAALPLGKVVRVAGEPAPVVFLFPGQGSQFLHMGQGLYAAEPRLRATLDACDAALQPILEGSVLEVMFGDDCAVLNRTQWAQPAIFALSYAIADLWRSWGVEPDLVVGHSLGEITAACVAGVFSLEDALRLVGERARIMQALAPGAMLATAAADEDLPALPEGLAVAAVNDRRHCVVSGATAAIESYAALLKSERIACRRLATSHAFHSPMMDAALPDIARLLGSLQLREAQTPLVSTVTGAEIPATQLMRVEHWLDNVRAPVRYADAIQCIAPRAPAYVETGPSNTLGSLTRSAGGARSVATSLAPRKHPEDEPHGLAQAVATHWCAGGTIDWQRYYGGQERVRVRLPAYPFDGRAFTLPAVAPIANTQWDQLIKRDNVEDWLYVPSWARTPSRALDNDIASAPWLIFSDGCELSSALVDLLELNGAEYRLAVAGDRFEQRDDGVVTLRVDTAADYGRLLRGLTDDGIENFRVVHLWALDATGRKARDRAATGVASTTETVPVQARAAGNVAAGLDRSFFSLLYLAQALGERPAHADLLITVVTRGAHDVDAADHVDPLPAVVGGPVRVISQEYSSVHCLQVDVESEAGATCDQQARQVLAEATRHGGEVLVAYRRETRWTRTYEAHPVPPIDAAATRLRDGGTYLITGGLGGLGLTFAEAIAGQVRADLILTSRAPIPPREEWRDIAAGTSAPTAARRARTLLAIERAGCRVFAVQADVTDAGTMRRALAAITAETGAVDGIIHAAGLPGEGIIQLRQPEQAARVLAPKVHGTLVLDALFADQPLDFFVLCSSIAAVLGGIGLVDYSAANHFLDAYAVAARTRPWKRVVSLDWDMWGEVGMGLQTAMPDELQGWLEKELADGLTCAEGVDVLHRALCGSREPQVVVSTRDLHARIDLWVRRKLIREREAALEDANAEPRYERPELSSDYDPPADDLERHVAEVWANLFEIERVGRHDNFFELGGHSLLAAVMLTTLGKRFEASVPISAVASNPTVAELALLFASQPAGKA